MMGQQLGFPVHGFHLESRRDPIDQLEEIARDKREALADVREVLDRYAEKHGIPAVEVTAAVTGYATDMIADLFYETASVLEQLGDAADLD
ncbi:MAG: hypothetical protein ABI024_11445 [Vicinamibacterales bacterium]